MTSTPRLLVPSVFCGPPASGNGGWSAGALAALVTGSALGRTVEVTLRLPPPLETPLPVAGPDEDGRWRALDDEDRVVLEARVVEDDLEESPPVAVEDARTGEAAYAGHRAHPFPTCFVCGPERAEGDGLRIFPGPVPGRPGVAAATWVPHASTLEIVWAALDCAGAWCTDMEERPRVLGRMTARIDRLPEVGALHVVTGEARGIEGRKHHATTTVRDASGALLGMARQVWIEVAP